VGVVGRTLPQRAGNALASAFVKPRGAYAPRSWLRSERLPAKSDFCDRRTHVHKSGGREPAVVLLTLVQSRTFSTVGLHRPLLVRDVRALHKAPFAMYKRMFTRAAGVSQPWLDDAHARRNANRNRRAVILAAAIAMRFSGAASAVSRVLGDRRCKRVFVIHGGLTPPAPGCGPSVCRQKSDFCDRRTHVHKSGGREPAVVLQTVSANAMNFRAASSDVE